MAIAQSTASNTSSFKLRVSFFDNPGKLYNAGNIVALGVGLLDCMVLSQAKLGATFAALNNFFIGSWPAIFTSLAVIFFFIIGQKYASAWANGYPPNVHAMARNCAMGTNCSSNDLGQSRLVALPKITT